MGRGIEIGVSIAAIGIGVGVYWYKRWKRLEYWYRKLVLME